MKEFIEYIARHLVDNPDGVVVAVKVEEDKKIVLTLDVNEKDIGKVIGRQGRTAQALRTLLTAIAAKEGKKAFLEIADKRPKPPSE
ncbi:MAG: RNA-binding protein [Chlorobiaceae bacterium]|nr:RNA-binding protein [Chlorobiaceae bacterium]MBA4310283.1 RNA-binding protein [Chlorobiaceae bacterium]